MLKVKIKITDCVFQIKNFKNNIYMYIYIGTPDVDH